MDVLKPDLLWIEGRCYRQFYRSSSTKGVGNTLNEGRIPNYAEDEERSCMPDGNYDPEEYEDDFLVNTTENGKYQTVFNIPRMYFGSIIGPKGSTRLRLQEETNTQIIVPSKTKDGDIVITGDSEKGVTSARRRIELIVTSSRAKQPFTHFLSIPVGNKQIVHKFLQFKDEICKRFTNHRIDESIFQVPEKLHLTLGTMVLGSTIEEKKIADMMQVFKETYVEPLLNNKTLRLRLVGVEYMNDDPREVDVLYAQVQLSDSSSLLQQLADDLVSFFQKRGFMSSKYDKVKLHLTLMNTLFRHEQPSVPVAENTNKTTMPIKKTRETFDASEILKAYETYDFGEHTVDTIHLSLRYSTGPGGYYKTTTCLRLK